MATALETVFPPVPSEVVLPLAGYTASQGHYGLVAAILCATVGSLVGAFVLYHLGGSGAPSVCATAERIPLLHARDVERAIAWFGRNGRSAIFLGRLVPGVRSFISIPAGIDRMPLLQFALHDRRQPAVERRPHRRRLRAGRPVAPGRGVRRGGVGGHLRAALLGRGPSSRHRCAVRGAAARALGGARGRSRPRPPVAGVVPRGSVRGHRGTTLRSGSWTTPLPKALRAVATLGYSARAVVPERRSRGPCVS